MRRIPCPIDKNALKQLYLTDKLTDKEIASHIGNGATAKRVRSWRKRFAIRTLQRWERYEVPPLEGRLRSLLVGSMLGDGRLVRRTHATHYIETHSEAQKPYLDWKKALWGSWAQSPAKRIEKASATRKYLSWRFYTIAHPALNFWQTLFYENSVRGWKILDSDVVDHIDEFALAIWYLDDGHAGWWPAITFGSTESSRQVAWSIFEKFKLRPRWQLVKTRHSHETGTFRFEGEDEAERFLSLIEPYVPSCMNYKLSHIGYRNGRNNTIRRKLKFTALIELANDGVPIRQMASMFEVSASTISRYLNKYNIVHPRIKGRPRYR